MTVIARESQERQLELFDVGHPSTPRQPRESLGRWWFHLRYDHVVLASVASVIGLTIIFACGVERGKHLVRAERLLLQRQETVPALSKASTPKIAAPSQPSAGPAASAKAAPAAPAAKPAPVVPSKTASKSRGRYAIQVVTFSRPVLAKQEMDRLQATGESAFLVMREGRTIVYVGPFVSKVNASEKLPTLKSRYRDCFVRAL